MQKHILTILVITLLLAPFVLLQANKEPGWVDDGGIGSGSGGASGGTSTNNTTPSISSKSNLFVETYDADNITQTTARLHGAGGDKTTNPTLRLTGYFRYSKAAISPIFCNDIYGSNMISTKDINLGAKEDKTCTQGGKYPDCIPPASQTFYQNIGDLSPNTTYYYCAIVSNKNNIAYGGESIVKQFRTNCYETIANTKSATNIKSTSARLNGSYCSAKIIANETGKTIEKVITYFEYRKNIAGGELSSFSAIPNSEQKYEMGDLANLYGNIQFNLLGLTPNTEYIFRTVVKTADSDANKKTTYGSPEKFTTIPGAGGRDTGGSGCTSCVKPTVTVTVTANPSSIKPGESTTISWTSTNTTACTTSAGSPGSSNETGITGSFNTGPLTNSKSYSVTCTGANGTRTGSVYVFVNTTGTGYTPQCSDTLDNDKDGKIDILDPNCHVDGDLNKEYVPTHYSELSSPVVIPPGTDYTPQYNPNNGTWGTRDGRTWTNGTWGTGTDSGTWTATSGTGGTGTVYWAGNGDGTGTWYSSTGSGTWTNGKRTGSAGTGTWTNLVLGQKAIPPWDAIVRYHEGIETVFIRQIMNRSIFTQKYGYQEGMNLQTFAEDLADQFARSFGYVNANGKEIRVGPPDIAAYQLELIGNKLTVYEYYANKIVDIRNTTATFKNKSDYEYYFKK